MEPKNLPLQSGNIAYYESLGRGPGVLLIHGNSASGLAFQRQLDSALGDAFHLVAIDLPGHGRSDRTGEASTYHLPAYAEAVAATAKQLGMEDAVVVGWSLGGHIALEAHNRMPRARGFVIFGTPPLAFPPAMDQAFLPNPAVNVGFKPDVSPEEATAYAASFFAPGAGADLKPFVDDILRADGNARAGLLASVRPGGYQDEVEIVSNLTRPLAVLHGEMEQLVSADYIRGLSMPTLWRRQIHVIPNAGHAAHWEQPAAFNALIEEFIADT